MLLVLPKWTGDADRAGWLTFATLKPLAFAQAPLDSALPEAELLRSEKSFVARSALLRGAAPVHLECFLCTVCLFDAFLSELFVRVHVLLSHLQLCPHSAKAFPEIKKIVSE